MMKKLMCLILALVTALSLVACGSSNGGNNTNTGDVKLKVLEGVVDWPETEPYRVLVQKGDPKGLLPGINKAIAELTADNNAKIHEIEEKVAEACGEHPFSIEGREQKTWMLMDYGSVVVHVFTPEARDFYRLEKLWGDAPQLPLNLL